MVNRGRKLLLYYNFLKFRGIVKFAETMVLQSRRRGMKKGGTGGGRQERKGRTGVREGAGGAGGMVGSIHHS